MNLCVYEIENVLYLNLTNRCNLNCVFCPRFSHYQVAGHFLKLEHEASASEFIKAIGDPSPYKEIVFCGYGEPTLRLRLILFLAQHLKTHWPQIPLRLNTNGLANLTYGRNILPQLRGRIDAISISLNADTRETYDKLCPSRYGRRTYFAVKNFIRQAKHYIPHVTASVLQLPELDYERCRQVIEDDLGVQFRYRPLMPAPTFQSGFAPRLDTADDLTQGRLGL